MPLQNRVTPDSRIEFTPHRGLYMGNRGRLHRPDKTLAKTTWGWKFWIICELVHNDWHRELMATNSYTELFFLDEAVALAAGHRPCAMCRNAAFKAYQATATDPPLRAPELDKILHQQRLNLHWKHDYPTADLTDLPDCVFVRLGPDGPPLLLYQDALLAFTHAGYQTPISISQNKQVQLLTPELSVQALRNGYRPVLHPTADNPLEPR